MPQFMFSSQMKPIRFKVAIIFWCTTFLKKLIKIGNHLFNLHDKIFILFYLVYYTILELIIY